MTLDCLTLYLTWIVVVTVGTMEAEVGVTLVEAVRLVGAMMEGRGESTVEGINMVEIGSR